MEHITAEINVINVIMFQMGFYIILFLHVVKLEWVEIPVMNRYSKASNILGNVNNNDEKLPLRKQHIEHVNDKSSGVKRVENVAHSVNMYLNKTYDTTTEILFELEEKFAEDFINSNLEKSMYVETKRGILKNEINSDNVLGFFKYIQNSLLSKVHKNFKSKMQVLRELRDTLLFNIGTRLRHIFGLSEARDYKDESHVGFPSNEGALMTIGFLTLAVFLVKLVLQVIHAIKSKKMYYNATMNMMNMNTAAALLGRKKRFVSLEQQTTYKILKSIEDIKYN